MNRYSRQVRRPPSSGSLILDFHAPLTTIFSPALPHRAFAALPIRGLLSANMFISTINLAHN